VHRCRILQIEQVFLKPTHQVLLRTGASFGCRIHQSHDLLQRRFGLFQKLAEHL
jgi:hypothetical protein